MANPIIEIKVTGFGTMKAELYPELAPLTVENFLKLVEEKFYDGLIFHRVIRDFMIQGGGYNEMLEQKEAPAIKGEFAANGFTRNTLRHTRGVLSMARTSNPNSASSQFFIMHMEAPHLNGQYAGFGKVTEGLDVVDKIANVKTGGYGYMGDIPRESVVIESIRVISK